MRISSGSIAKQFTSESIYKTRSMIKIEKIIWLQLQTYQGSSELSLGCGIKVTLVHPCACFVSLWLSWTTRTPVLSVCIDLVSRNCAVAIGNVRKRFAFVVFQSRQVGVFPEYRSVLPANRSFGLLGSWHANHQIPHLNHAREGILKIVASLDCWTLRTI